MDIHIKTAQHSDGTYCERAVLTRKCPLSHHWTIDPIKVPTTHSDVISEVQHNLFLRDAHQRSDTEALDAIAESWKRYLQLGQHVELARQSKLHPDALEDLLEAGWMPRVTTHDSRCTLDPNHAGECNVSAWRG